MKQILFIPGIKGSELHEGSNKRWFPKNVEDLNVLKCIDRELDAKSLLTKVNIFQIPFLNFHLYTKIINEFPQDQLSLFPYDWRQSITVHIPLVVERIIQLYEISEESIIIVAHSMGGILAKLAILELASRGMHELVTKFITIGTPWLGAPDAYKVLDYGDTGLFSEFESILQVFNDKLTREVAQCCPSTYQLLPSEEYFKKDNGEFLVTQHIRKVDYSYIKEKTRLFFSNNGTGSEVDIWAEYIEPIHNAMLQPLPSNIKHDCLVGYNYPTLYKIAEKGPDEAFLGFSYKPLFKNGDKVVPLISAIPPHAEESNVDVYFVKGKHRNLCNKTDVIDFINWSIDGKKSEMPSGIKVESPESLNGTEAFISCPVDTTILDINKRYVAGLFDSSISEISDLAENATFYTIGDTKYFYLGDDVKEDVQLHVNAYGSGLAEIAVQRTAMDETIQVVYDPIIVDGTSTAVLTISISSEDITETKLKLNGEDVQKNIITDVLSKPSVEIPTLSVHLSSIPVSPERLEAPLEARNVSAIQGKDILSGRITLEIRASNDALVDQIYYSTDKKTPVKYNVPIELSMNSGEHSIAVFGRDKSNRPIPIIKQEFLVDDMQPITKPNFKFQPDGLIINFDVEGISETAVTHFRIIHSDEDSSNVAWRSTHGGNEIPMAWGNLKDDLNAYVNIEFYSVNIFGVKEQPNKSIRFALGFVPHLIWSESSIALTSQAILSNILMQHVNAIDVVVTVTSSKEKVVAKVITFNERIDDNIRVIKFDLESCTLEVLYAEKYSLYFPEPPKEMLEIGQEYQFSFALLTSEGENVTYTRPRARLHYRRGRLEDDKYIVLEPKNGGFFGIFTVDELFVRNKYYKLIITDNKNVKPALREIPLILK